MQEYHQSAHTCIFVSHHWWVRAGDSGADKGAPDHTKGERANLKLAVVLKGVAALIAREGLDESKVQLCAAVLTVCTVLAVSTVCSFLTAHCTQCLFRSL